MRAWATLLGMAATAVQLAVPDVFGGVISKILEVAEKACENREECKQLAEDVQMISRMLPYLQELQHTEVMAELAATLQEALQLVESCKGTSFPVRVVKTTWEARKYEDVRSKIKVYLDVFPMISHVDLARRFDGLRILVLEISKHLGVRVPRVGFPQEQEVAEEECPHQLPGVVHPHRHVLQPQEGHIVCGAGRTATKGQPRLVLPDYMDNGSTLRDHLQSPLFSSSPVVGSWKTRIEVLLAAVRYIRSAPSVVHDHITSSNVLLHGASITCPSLETDERTNKEMKGYIDPVFGRLNRASGVYRFGVVMLETVTGMQPVVAVPATCDCDGVGRKGRRNRTLVLCVRRFIEANKDEGLRELLDKRPAPEPTPWQLRALGLVAHTAMCCVRPEWMKRPTIPEVAAKLEKALDLFCSKGEHVEF